MLKTTARSFRSRATLAVGLSWLAGYVNCVLLLAAGHVVSHMTGNVTHLGQYAARAADRRPGAAAEAAYFAALVACFVAGSFASGVLTTVGRRTRYVLPMTVEAVLLAVVVILLERYPHPRHGWPLVAVTGTAAVAMGLQNGTITRISGAVVRTTHLTGVVTDLGLSLAAIAAGWRRAWRTGGRTPDVRRAVLLGSILISFLTGAAAGAAAHHWFEYRALYAPIAFLIALVIDERRAAVADVRPAAPPANWAGVVPPTVGLFVLTHAGRRPPELPDFAAWAATLPPTVRVAVLRINPATRLHGDAAVNLLAADAALRSAGRSLIVVGVDHRQLKRLRRTDPHHRLRWADFPPDLDAAAVRAIDLAGLDVPQSYTFGLVTRPPNRT